MEVGKRISELREKRGLTTNKLANLCGLSQSFVRSVELGEKGITVENLGLICEVLHVSLRDFFDVPTHINDLNHQTQLQDLIIAMTPSQQSALLQLLQSFKI